MSPGIFSKWSLRNSYIDNNNNNQKTWLNPCIIFFVFLECLVQCSLTTPIQIFNATAHLPPTEKTKLINSFIFYIHLNKKTKAEKPIYERERERERERETLSVKAEMR